MPRPPAAGEFPGGASVASPARAPARGARRPGDGRGRAPRLGAAVWQGGERAARRHHLGRARSREDHAGSGHLCRLRRDRRGDQPYLRARARVPRSTLPRVSPRSVSTRSSRSARRDWVGRARERPCHRSDGMARTRGRPRSSGSRQPVAPAFPRRSVAPAPLCRVARVISVVLEAATYVGSVALLDGGRLLGERTVAMRGREHEALMPATAALLEGCGVAPEALGRVACGAVPGSFTSLRIARGIAKGRALATGIPLVPVSSLSLLVSSQTAPQPAP